MKKQCVLIQAHKNIDYILELAKIEKNVNFYVHIDKKSNFKPDLKGFNNIHLLKNTVDVYWGGISQVKATINLFKESLKNKENEYFHLISGEDIVLKRFSEILDEWINTYDSKMLFECLEHKNSRFRTRFNHPLANTKFQRIFVGRLYTKYMKIILDRLIPSNKTSYLGSQWFSVCRSDIESIISYIEENNVMEYFNKKLCPDEHLFQYVISNSTEIKIRNMNLNKRYIVFDKGYNNGTNPIYLDKDQITEAKLNGYWFARKIRQDVGLKHLEKDF